MVKQYAPILRTSAGPVLDALISQVPHDQQGKILKLVDKVSKRDKSETGQILNDLVQEVVPVLEKKIHEPEFADKFIKDVVTSGALEGGGLEAILKTAIPAELHGIMEPLLKFLSLDGASLLNNLDRLSIKGTGEEKLMDGPLRTLFLLMNLLAYSTSLGEAGASIGATGAPNSKGFAVVDAAMKAKTSVMWWVPESIVKVFQVLCGMLKLELVSLSMMQDYLVTPEAAALDPMVQDPAVLHVVVATFQSTTEPSRKVTVHTARAGLGAGEESQLFGINDLFLLMGLYEAPIRESVGFLGLKYFSLLDYIYKWGQGLAQWDWLMTQLGQEENQMVQSVASFDEKRKAIREQLAAHIQTFTEATLGAPSAEEEITHVYTGVSLGGSIARMMAMRNKLSCEKCHVVALTVNAPQVHRIVQKIGLLSEDEQKLKDKKYLFGAFVNFVAQHDVIWKLDEPLPGSSTCMYIHAAETAGCRGVESIGRLYGSLQNARSACKAGYRNLERTEQSQPCILEEMAPVLQCIAQEHAFVLRSGVKDMWQKAQEDMSIVVGDIFEAFASMKVQTRHGKDISWFKAGAGSTITTSLTSHERHALQAKRRAAYDRIDADLHEKHKQIEAEFAGKSRDIDAEWAKLSSCTGCTEDWCAEKDVREHRCCAADANDVCKYAPYTRTKCRGDAQGETCSGVGRFIGNQGRRCACMTGYCWDGSGCSRDRDFAKRQELTRARKDLDKEKELWLQLRSSEAARKKDEFEASVVKHVDSSMIPFVQNSTSDAKPDPAFDKSWICTM